MGQCLLDRRLLISSIPTLNLELWLNAGKINGLSNGDSISLWEDKSGNGRNATQSASSYQPLYKTNIKNGKPAVYFDGTNDYLSISGSSSSLKFLHSDKSTIFLVAQAGFSADPNITMAFMDSSGGSWGNIGYSVSYTDVSAYSYNNRFTLEVANSISTNRVDWQYQDNVLTPNSMHIIKVVGDMTNSTAANRSSIEIDGMALTSLNSQAGAPSTSNSSYDIVIGTSANLFAYLYGYICELIIYSRNLSANEISKVETYLSSKYAISL